MGKNDYYFSDHLRLRMEQRGIMKQWILAVIDEPDKTEYIADDEIHFLRKMHFLKTSG